MSAAGPSRPVLFGEVLFDRFPSGEVVLGGAPLNVARHLAAFGRDPLLVTGVGDDELGARAREAATAWGLDDAGFQHVAGPPTGPPTGTVEVTLAGGEPTYEIAAPSAYDALREDALPDVGAASLLYHGTLALRDARSVEAFEALAQRLDAPRFVDVNLREPWWRRAEVLDRIEGAAWLKLNVDELEALADGDDDATARALLESRDLGAVLLTRGARGASLITREARYDVAPEPPPRLVDAVGAGDAFTSVVLLGILEGWPPGLGLERAQRFASAMLGVRGATVDDRAFYAPFLAEWSLT